MLVVKHSGSNCPYLKGKLKCRLSGFQTEKVHWNRASANLQFGFFHSPVLSPPFKKGRFWFLTFSFWIQSCSHSSRAHWSVHFLGSLQSYVSLWKWSFLLSMSDSYICRLWKRMLGQFISVLLWQRWFWKNSDRNGERLQQQSLLWSLNMIQINVLTPTLQPLQHIHTFQ